MSVASVNIVSPNGYGTDYYLRSFYGQDRGYISSSTRAGATNSRLSVADSHALKKALDSIELSTEKEDEEARTQIAAYVDTYNNLLSSSTEVSSRDIRNVRVKMKELNKKYAEEFEKIGVSVSSSGKLKITKATLSEATADKISDIFGKDTEYMKEMDKYKRKMEKLTTANKQREDSIMKAKSIDIQL